MPCKKSPFKVFKELIKNLYFSFYKALKWGGPNAMIKS
nr:MAG TPA: hypothetical protein [Caudoviricetes sp.]DAS01225.1 MAG TPA: hypothetical protein [Caudoviricetes sp.]